MSQSKGIGGILDQIVGTDDGQWRWHPKPCPPANRAQQVGHESRKVEPSDPGRRIAARRGRPLGNVQPPECREPKAKVTVWITQTLIDQYRDWSWDVRHPLSRLVQQAMEDYRNHCRMPPAS